MTPDQKIEQALLAKNRGNCLFREANPSAALAEYSQVLAILEDDLLFPADHKNDAKALKLVTSLNIAACQLKLGEFKDVIGICTEVNAVTSVPAVIAHSAW
eukprot:m.773749 g.773749  ORF g.773749 m.773749 type:complete len:101 (-) comp59099_c0_seq3:61-363(-)